MIYRQEGYVLKEIKGKYALLPVGQSIADQKKGITLNETGVFLWNMLEEQKSRETLAEELMNWYGADITEKDVLQKDVNEFLDHLLVLGILREDLKPVGEPFYGCIELAGLHVKLYGKPLFFSESFLPFQTEYEAPADMEIEIVNAVPCSRQTGKVLLQNEEMMICEWQGGYVVHFPTMQNIMEAYMTEDGKYVRIYCLVFQDQVQERENLFHAIRLFFLYRAQKSGYFAIHSASILYRQKAWLFSGHSGCGKSTHTALWHENVGTLHLNGDLNLVGRNRDGRWFVYGIPWCGTSGICTVQDYELGGIVLLEQADTDRVQPLSGYEKVLRVMQRMISPAWTVSLMEYNLQCAQELEEEIPVYHLLCTKNPSAVTAIKAQIDNPEV